MPDTSKEVLSKTLGETMVGIDFNPSNDDLVYQIKSKYAEIIDLLNNNYMEATSGNMYILDYTKTAITQAQTAQMRAVKAVTAK